MIERTIYPEWRAQNGTTKYPFADYASLRNVEGRQLLEGTFLDAVLYPIGGAVGLYLSRIVVTHETITLVVGNVANQELCSGSFDVISPPDVIKLVDAAERPAGVLVSEGLRLAILQSLGVGTHEFNLEETEFCASCCIPTPEVGLRGVRLPDGTVIVGDVWLVGDDGVVVRHETMTEPAACGVSIRELSAIRIDIVGDPLYRRRLCTSSDLFSTPRFIKTVRVIGPNGSFDCTPDEFGELKLAVLGHAAVDTVLRFTPTADGLALRAVGQALKE